MCLQKGTSLITWKKIIFCWRIDSVSDPNPESGSGSRRAKMTYKNRKKTEISYFEVLDVLF
jgi:hypothetical protein